jgi:hypothetical protein
MWLDFKIFGNGWGLKSPLFDDTFYWLVDTADKERHERNGRFYKWSGGFGAQLSSFEWRVPAPGTRRRLFDRDFRVFQAHRRGLRVDCSWAIAQSNCPSAEEIRELKRQLQEAA